MGQQNRSCTTGHPAAHAAGAEGSHPTRTARNQGGAVAVLLIILLILVNGLMLAGLLLPEPTKKTTRRGIDTPGEVLSQVADAKASAVQAEPEPAVGKATAKPITAKADTASKPAPQAKPAPKSEPVTEGTHVVAAGIFRSQKYLMSLEQRLDKMELPHYRDEVWKEGEAFRLAVGDTPAARSALEGARYTYSVSGGKLYAFFHFEDVAQKAANTLEAAGAEANVKSFQGQTPVWSLYVGPMNRGPAKDAVKKMKAKRIDGYVIPRPE